MTLQFYNSLSKRKEPFSTLEAGHVRMYTCGPTVYNFAHVGNFRAYLFEDVLRRTLEYAGYQMTQVMNLTDVDDKTIRGSRQKGVPLKTFTQPFVDAFFADLKALNVEPAEVYPAATDHVPEMIAIIEKLMAKGLAYQSDDKSVYFKVAAFPEYGKLAHLDMTGLKAGARVAQDEYEKESVGDFALWKAWDKADGDVGWESPWGRGRPGWHIECSAMATAILGPQMDIHCGGVDNIFPHHEAEIAQSECCSGTRFVRYWLHCAHLMVDGQKMAKSLGNFYTLRDLIAKGWTGREVRYALINVHYRLPLNFTFEGLAAARSALQRIDEWQDRLKKLSASVQQASDFSLPAQTKFEEALDDDLNISGALGHLFDVIRETNRAIDENTLGPQDASALFQWWNRINSVLGIGHEEASIPPEIQALIEERRKAREAKDWKKSDELRRQIEEKGWIVKDMKEGQKVTKAP